jgi:hypothetical protein
MSVCDRQVTQRRADASGNGQLNLLDQRIVFAIFPICPLRIETDSIFADRGKDESFLSPSANRFPLRRQHRFAEFSKLPTGHSTSAHVDRGHSLVWNRAR